MANNWFKFKEFTIHQGNTAMKVGTDGVLLGAWANVSNKNNILDIGTGTGLIALMLAQRNNSAQIDAVEIDKDASLQAKSNFEQSSWSERLSIYYEDIQTFESNNNGEYDLIVSNPPFYQNSTEAKTIARQNARSNKSLNFEELIKSVSKLLKKEGSFALIIPYDVFEIFDEIAENHKLKLARRCIIYPKNNSKPKRVLLEYKNRVQEIVEEELVIEPTERHQYSEKYKQLTKEFYLKF